METLAAYEEATLLFTLTFTWNQMYPAKVVRAKSNGSNPDAIAKHRNCFWIRNTKLAALIAADQRVLNKFVTDATGTQTVMQPNIVPNTVIWTQENNLLSTA
jgi:hypothetical protein